MKTCHSFIQFFTFIFRQQTALIWKQVLLNLPEFDILFVLWEKMYRFLTCTCIKVQHPRGRFQISVQDVPRSSHFSPIVLRHLSSSSIQF